MTTKYGNRNVPKMISQWDAHRQACRAEGTPLIQATLDAMEEHIDFAYRAIPARGARDAAQRLRAYMDRRKRAHGFDQETVHTFDAGTDHEVTLAVADLDAAILALIGEART